MSDTLSRAMVGSERLTQLQMFEAANNVDEITAQFRDGNASYELTYKRLSQQRCIGLLKAGEIAVEQAYLATDGDSSLERLAEAGAALHGVQVHAAVSTRYNFHHSIRAKLLQQHLPAHALLATEGSLPPPIAIEKLYGQTIRLGQRVVQELAYRTTNWDRRGRRLSGRAAEMSVFGLAKRGDLLSIGTKLSMPSHESQDNRNTKGSTINHAWDISGFAEVDGLVHLGTRLQVKSRKESDEKSKDHKSESDPGIITVYVDPDLKLDDSEEGVSINIIQELADELHGRASLDTLIRISQRVVLLEKKIAA